MDLGLGFCSAGKGFSDLPSVLRFVRTRSRDAGPGGPLLSNWQAGVSVPRVWRMPGVAQWLYPASLG
jgi:hypothetical protein